MLSRSVSASAFILSVATAASLTAQVPDQLRLEERGQVREFAVANDEIHEGRVARKVAPHTSAEALRSMLRAAGKGDLVLYPKGEARTKENRRMLTGDVAVRITDGTDIQALARTVGATVLRAVNKKKGWWLLRAPEGAGSGLEVARALRRTRGVTAAHPQLAQERVRRFTPNDPMFAEQWHLDNFGQSSGVPGIDANVIPAWDFVTGNGVTLAIVDDGLERVHPDLSPRYRADLSFDFNFRDNDPMPAPFVGDIHGTSCAGLAAGAGNNGMGIAGVAFEADLIGLRLISRPTTDVDEADCFAFKSDLIDIKSNSWGPFDDGKALEGPGPLALEALRDSVENGRGGKGTVFVWAAGNGRRKGDDSNYDGFANSRETISVSAIENFSESPDYAEGGANIVVSAPSSGGSLAITTTDAQANDGYNFQGSFFEPNDRAYTNSFGGTSAACPIVAGVVALMLEARPNLGWRDVQQILIDTARQVPLDDPAWFTNTSGRHFHPRFGAGLVDASAAVLAAATVPLLDNVTSFSLEDSVPAPIPDFRKRGSGVVKSFNFSGAPLRVEHAVVTIDAAHASRGQLEIRLRSPGGTESVVAPVRKLDRGDDYVSWSFCSVQFWGEMADAATGTWTVHVVDRIKGTTGSLRRVKLELFGTSPIGNVKVGSRNVIDSTNGDLQPQPGETVTMEITLENTGSDSIANLTATLLGTGGVANVSGGPVSYGQVVPSQSKSAPFTFQVTGTLGSTVAATMTLKDGQTDLGTVSFPILLGRKGSVLISSDGGLIENPVFPKRKGNADPYPSTATVAGAPAGAVVTKVRLFLDHVGARRTDEIDALLVSPSGKSVVVLSDAGAEGANDASLVFTDDALVPLNQTRYFNSGTYRPTNFGPGVDAFPSPAPQGARGANLSDLNGETPNGVWSLFVRDDGGRGYSAIAAWHVEVEYVF